MNELIRTLALGSMLSAAAIAVAEGYHDVAHLPSPALTIAASQAVYAPGAPIVIDVTLTNVARQPLVVQGIYTLGYEGSPYELRVRRVRTPRAVAPGVNDDEDPPRHEAEKPALPRVAQRPFRAIELQPDESASGQVSVREFSDLRRPGTYELRIVRKAGRQEELSAVPAPCTAALGGEGTCDAEPHGGRQLRAHQKTIRWGRVESNVLTIVVAP